eukprot:TRINITY_DN13515_c0_g1_i2.p1 TRINITY_DN13515_c0_g1~~TRINITY_DN13515_c0_g1_i2.p1  ORF type:complete len:349 (-),score=15.03 TRINITY_DN13515_c0_g1_i2:56-1042(-)
MCIRDRVLTFVGMDSLTIPAVILAMVNDALKAFLHAQNVFGIPMYMNAIGLPFHIFICWLLLIQFQLGLLGAAIALTATEIFKLIVILLFIKYFGLCKETWGGWSKKCLQGWLDFVKVCLPLGMLLYVEWLAFELYAFQVGLLGDNTQMASYVIIANIYINLYQLAYGACTTVNTLVSIAVGEKSKRKAVDYTNSSVITSMLHYIVILIIWLLLKDIWFNAFTQSSQVAELIAQVTPWCLAVMPFDWIQGVLSGVLKGVDYQTAATIAALIAHYIFGQPITYLWGNYLNHGLCGIWKSYAVATMILFFTYLFMILTLDWDKQLSLIHI